MVKVRASHRVKVPVFYSFAHFPYMPACFKKKTGFWMPRLPSLPSVHWEWQEGQAHAVTE